MKVLVVGAGPAGLTLAGRLSQQGRPPVVVERATSPEGGYAIGLYPLGSCVLHGLGLYDHLVECALTVERYELRSASGRPLQAMDMSLLTGAVGPMLMVSRTTLVEVLETGCANADLRRGVTVTDLRHEGEQVAVTFDDGTAERFDLVVACDGIASSLRAQHVGPADGFDSGWVLWTWWTGAERFRPEVTAEWWGPGCFFGAYPAPGQVMCAAGGPAASVDVDHDRTAVRRLVEPMASVSDAIRGALDDLDAGATTHRWPMRDVRSERWSTGRVAVCGDAAVGFLPTAGVGASNAMRAAAALADELSRADASTVPLALELYEKRCRSVIERNQTESRRLSRLMFVSHPALAWGRDQLARRYPAERVLGQIIASVHEPF